MKFNPKTLRKNILSAYSQATPEERKQGLFWYQTAHNDAQAIAHKHGVTIEQAVGVISAISPGLEWGLNLLQADSFIGAFVKDGGTKLPSVGVYGRKNRRKALNILFGEKPLSILPMTGPKTRAFYSCILDPQSSAEVCVDRHAKCLATNRTKDREAVSAVRAGEYKNLVRAYSDLAEELGLISHQLQAITWVAWKRLVS